MHNICRAGGKIRSSVSRFSYQLRTLRVEVLEMKRFGERNVLQWIDRSDFLEIAESQMLQEYHVTFTQCHFGN